jgi:hypothetical protein
VREPDRGAKHKVEPTCPKSAPTDSINQTTTVHRPSWPYSHSSCTDAGGHHGSRDRPRPEHYAGLTMQPAGYETYWQYTTALAFSVLAATKPVTSSADKAMESLILVSPIFGSYPRGRS